jgi:O-acetyl-ADP-ribose deacetylase (regulator of RNase III)
MNITSLALPPLGCGLGGLQWEDVYTMMLDYLTPLEIEIDIYKPY